MRSAVAIPCLLLAAGATAAQPKRAVDFETDVRPIFAKSCYACHGPQKQKSDFRLDQKAAALKGGDNGVAIVPGKAGESPLFDRISTRNDRERMPPKGNPVLTEAEIGTIRAWIEQGAKWPDYPAAASNRPHWAYQPLQVPAGAKSIDAFILDKLHEKGLSKSPPAEKRVWLRRVTFDLIGLPPTPEEMNAFLSDVSPGAFATVVDRLLASPHYGERWARHWIDVVHFAESHGHDQDRPRPNAWPYRDYLIQSFNADKPYARFVQEQVAGDVLYPNDPPATVALGMLAAGPWDESSLRDIVAGTTDNLIGQVLDRDDMLTTVMTTFVSSTVNCARCHNHKFDPISTQDYYALQAVFAGVDRAERAYDPDLSVMRRRRELLARKRELDKGLPESALLAAETQLKVAAWEERAKTDYAAWDVVTPKQFASSKGTTAKPQPDGSLLCDGKPPEIDTYWITTVARNGATGVRLEVLPDASLPKNGPGRQDNGNLHLSEFLVLVWPGGGLPPVPWPIKRAVADFNQEGWTIQHAIDGHARTAWGIYPEVGKPHGAVFEFAKPLPAGRAVTFALFQLHGGHHLIGRPRLSLTAAANPVKARPLPPAAAAALAIPAEKRTPAQRAELARFVLKLEVDDAIDALPPPALVYAAASDFKPEGSFKPTGKPKPVSVLRRGDINSPIEPAKPGTLACIPALPSRFDISNPDDEGARRAGLARWLSSPDNVLTWRSIVNRVWHYHFGKGLVDTPNDFGRMGSTPSHPELLDWLAIDFRDHGESIKRLHKQIVLSETYRQSSQQNPAAATIDGDNRLLWKMNSTRLEAEELHDAVLAVSGKLDRTMGGPSVKQFIQSPGVHVTPVCDYASFNVDDAGNFRRSVYRFLMRTVPDPFMDVMDHPDGSQQAPVRSASMTALQALAMLNNKFMVRQSEHLAARLAREAPTPEAQVQRLYQLALGRDAKPNEVALLAEHGRKYGMANVCRVVLNSNEFIFVP
jgi:mono/diheme cytochrome c family protein